MKTLNLLWGLSLLFGCGAEGQAGSGGGQLAGSNLSCVSALTPCGGTIVGTWEMESSCANSTDECKPQSVAYASGYSVTYNADGTFNMPPVHYKATWATPASCYAGPSGASDCASQEMALGAGNGCSLSSDGSCACSVTASGSDSIEGTYTASGTHLTITSIPGSTSQYTYCVQGNRMAQWQGDDATSAPDIVWVKR